VNGARGAASAGFPWRHLSSYTLGQISETGDRCQSPLTIPPSFLGKKIGQFSQRSMLAVGMKELLSPNREECTSPLSSTAASSPASLSAAIASENAGSARE
ncbi:unnamed protein product, partial [Polarella glacialis]